ncbi:MAG: hypothetical protein AAF533_05340 [Acidobacteriota bacterium]
MMSRRPRVLLGVFVLLLTTPRSSLGRAPSPPSFGGEPTPVPVFGCNLSTPTQLHAGESFEITISVVHLGSSDPTDSTIFDDQHYRIVPPLGLEHGLPLDQPGRCEVLSEGLVVVDFEPTFVDVVLDDPSSPVGDHPSTAEATFTVTIEELPDWTTLRWPGSCGGEVSCTHLFPAEEPLPPVPDAIIEDEVGMAPAGGSVPFRLLVRRNGYRPTHPLRVVVEPENPVEPQGLFPIEPAELRTTGAMLEAGADETVVDFECHPHFPCFTGMPNRFHVRVFDDELVVWDSREVRPTGIARAWVEEMPRARIELLELVETSGDGRVQACEDATLRVRLALRNGHRSALEDVSASLELPEELELIGSELHHHDNLLDDVTPTPAALAAEGLVRQEGRRLVVETSRVLPRFHAGPEPPAVFHDLLEVDLHFATESGGVQRSSELRFSDLTVRGTVEGVLVEESTSGFVLPVGPGTSPAPGEVSAPDHVPLRVGVAGAPDLVTWDDGVESGATSYRLYRGTVSELSSAAGRCLAAGLLEPRFLDEQRPPPGVAWCYLVAGHACLQEGPVGNGSRGAARVVREDCP